MPLSMGTSVTVDMGKELPFDIGTNRSFIRGQVYYSVWEQYASWYETEVPFSMGTVQQFCMETDVPVGLLKTSRK